jgi:ketosteroid isomerase-like protein
VAKPGEAELVELERQWMAAVRDRDVEFLEDLLAEEFTLITGRPGVEVRSRAEWLAITGGEYAIDEFGFQEIVARAYGDAGVVLSRYRQTARMGDQDRSAAYLMTDVFVRRDGHWRAVVRHISPLGDRPVGRNLAGEPLA